MSLDQRTHVPQGEISGGEAMVEKGATEVVGAEVETEVAMVETEVGEVMVETGVGVAMVGIEEVAMEETEVVMVGTEEAAMEETEVATEETEVAMEETEVAMEVIEEAMEVIEVDMEETAAGGPMEETVVVVVVAVEATVETEVEATVETEVVATEETEVAMEAKWEEETTTEMISATDHTDDCFRYSFVSDMIRGELSECACCFPHGKRTSRNWKCQAPRRWGYQPPMLWPHYQTTSSLSPQCQVLKGRKANQNPKGVRVAKTLASPLQGLPCSLQVREQPARKRCRVAQEMVPVREAWLLLLLPRAQRRLLRRHAV